MQALSVRALPVELLALAALAGACGGDGAGETPADTGLAAVPADGNDAAQAAAYPPGPYGVMPGETIDDLGFYAPETEEQVHLSQWYQHGQKKLLMIVSTAAW